MARPRLMDFLGGAAPVGMGEVPVGTDEVPTDELASMGPAPEEGAVEPDSAAAIAQAPDMTPEEQAQLQASIELAAKEELMKFRQQGMMGGM